MAPARPLIGIPLGEEDDYGFVLRPLPISREARKGVRLLFFILLGQPRERNVPEPITRCFPLEAKLEKCCGSPWTKY